MVKWQTGAVGSVVSLFFLLGLLLNLSGVSWSDDGDKVCTDCFSEIRINSTYWEVRVTFERPDEDLVFKKRTRSRTLWINLHKIDELVTTDPQVKVDILVPTNRIAFTEINHEEYGRLRFLKEGDTLIRRSSSKRPGPSRIILHGQDINQVVKWNFDLEHFLLQDINIDPIWSPDSYKEIINCDIRIEYDTCSKTVAELINYTYINNLTAKNEQRTRELNHSEYYNCNPKKVSENCKTIGINTTDLIAYCPERYRCDIIGNQFCYVSLDDGDKNFNFKQANGRGWEGGCIRITELKEGEIRVNSYRKVYLNVEKR